MARSTRDLFNTLATIRLHEKGGKRHEMPTHHNLEAYLDSYLEAVGILDAGKTPLFRSVADRTGTLTDKPMNRVDAWRMIQRRAADLGTRSRIGCHTFRATGITPTLKPAALWRMLKPWLRMRAAFFLGRSLNKRQRSALGFVNGNTAFWVVDLGA